MVVCTRGKRKLDEAEGRVVVLVSGQAKDPNYIMRYRRRRLKRQKQEEASTHQFFNLISADLKRQPHSFFCTS